MRSFRTLRPELYLEGSAVALYGQAGLCGGGNHASLADCDGLRPRSPHQQCSNQQLSDLLGALRKSMRQGCHLH